MRQNCVTVYPFAKSYFSAPLARWSIVLARCRWGSFFFFQAEDGIRDYKVTGVQTCALPISASDCRAWRCKGLPPIRVAVNISPPELRQRNIAGEILEAIGDLVGDPAWGIDIEITEGALGDSSSCVHALRLLRAAGIRIAIDDFGTGFSSLGRLSRSEE